MSKIMTLLVVLGLAGCTTPETVLRHPTTGQVARCGGNVTGSLAGGMIGYAIQESNDTKCTAAYLEQVFIRVK